MKALNETPINLRAVGITMTLAALAIALLAVAMTASPTLAQTPPGSEDSPGGNTDGNTDGGNADRYPNLSTYPDPQPCGPGAGTAFMKEPHEITTGHYALFDAYWRTISNGVVSLDTDGVGVLHTNECPPEMVATSTDDGFGNVTETTIRSAREGGMDIEEAIIHVLDKHLATTTVASTTEANAGELSLAEYPRVGEVVNAGDRVWWLRLDDPGTTSTDEASDLGMGFSTLLLDKERWHTRESEKGEPMRYRFEVERHPADPTDVPHFFAYEAPNIRNIGDDGTDAGVKLVWDSEKPGEGVMELDPGEYRALQWVFTKPGTYLLWVHLLGDVKKPGTGDDWKAISSNYTETSEVYQYTIQVGTDLDETEPPIFGVNLEVEENSPGGVNVGDPIPIYNAEADVLYYDLTGPGHSNFDLVASTEPFTVQVVVTDGADLDYEAKSSYDLHLSVTDKVDHENNFNPYADDVLIVRIDLKDQAPGLKIQADRTSLKVNETVNFTAWFEPTPERRGQTPTYVWAEKINPVWDVRSSPGAGSTWSVSQSSPTTKTYRAAVEWTNEDTMQPTFVNSNEITITWKN